MFRPFMLGLFSMLIAAATLRAEDAERAPFAIATLNVPKFFKECAPFTRKMDAFKKKLADAEADLRERQQGLTKDRIKIMEAKAEMSTEEFNAAEKLLAEKTAAFQIEMNIKKREFLQEEAEYYVKAYDSMCAEVKKICQARKIRLVIHSRIGEKEDSEERDDILQRVNRAVIFANEIDLTDEVIQAINAAKESPPQEK